MELNSFTLKNSNGLEMRVINLGGIVTHLKVPDCHGVLEDIVLGFDDDHDYLKTHPYFGALIGRVANRVAFGRFELEGVKYELACNWKTHHLHGGNVGFDKVYWTCRLESSQRLELFYQSVAGEEGYPGNLKVKVNYILDDNDEWRIEYEATADKATPINLTQHSYFNLSGKSQHSIHDHELRIDSDFITEMNHDLIPTGKLKTLDPILDFRQRRRIGLTLDQLPGGYDHNYILNGKLGSLKKAAEIFEPHSGRIMEVLTTEPGLQFYSGNFLDGTLKGKNQEAYRIHRAFCVEAQHFPDSPNHKEFPSVILLPGRIYRQTTVYRFGTSK
jgi:aldose 1-epimerase